ncbi:DASH complex subunit DAD2 [Candida viswanathii]|uniref:DASH complex subunit DAD2 n=1 Tax=Candida viswanathii TaxID=5486 RepID=A0A367XPU9_9ASCO|nr:DASH complex subunit DAD2 [Candida viswanathii]
MQKPTTSTTSSTSSSSQIYQKIAEKRANLETLREFRSLTSDLVAQLESIGDKLETMNGGTASVALILLNWQSVVLSISLASLALVKNGQDGRDEDGVERGEEKFPEPLVRVKLDQLDSKPAELHDDELEEDEE